MLNIMYATNETQCVELAYSLVSLLKHNKNYKFGDDLWLLIIVRFVE